MVGNFTYRKNIFVSYTFLLVTVRLLSISLVCFSPVQPFVSLWTVAHQAPLSMGFSWQEYWSGFPCPPPGDLPNPGIEPESLTSLALAGGFFTTNATWEALLISLKQKGKKISSLKLAPVFLTFKKALIT